MQPSSIGPIIIKQGHAGEGTRVTVVAAGPLARMQRSEGELCDPEQGVMIDSAEQDTLDCNH